MKRNASIWIGIFLLVLLALSLACGGGDEPTATPESTSTPEPPPTATPTEVVPTATAVPSPEPEPEEAETDMSLGMIPAESEVHGVRLCYPEGWSYEDSFLILLSSDPDYDLFAAEDEMPDNLVMLIMAGASEEMEAEELSGDSLTELVEEFGGEEVELLGDFEESTVNGAEVKTVEFRGIREGIAVRGLVAVFVKDDLSAVAVGLSPEELWDENADAVGAVLDCIDLFEGTGLSFEMDEESVPAWYGELSYGEKVHESLLGGEIHSWTFAGSAGEVISLILTPLGDEMDLSLQLLGPDDEVLIDLDDQWDGEVESLSGFELPADGQYSVHVREFFDAPGDYELELQEGGDPEESGRTVSGEMILAENEMLGVRLQYPDGWYFDDSFLVIMASDEATLMAMDDDATELDGFVGIVIPFPPDEMEGESFEGMFDQMGDMFGAEGEGEVEMLGLPTMTTINGADVQLAEFLLSEAEQVIHAKFAVFNNGEQAAVALVFGPDDQWNENTKTVDAIVESIELFEGSGLDFGEMPSTEAVFRGSLEYGTQIEDEFASGEAQLWVFEGSMDDYISVIVNPLDSEMDVTIELLSADSTTLAEVDDDFGGKAEMLVDYQLPADGEYQIVIGEYWEVAGAYELELIGGDEPVGPRIPPGMLEMGNVPIGEPVSAVLIESQEHVWTLPAKGGELVNIVVDPGEDETDLAVSVIAPDGSRPVLQLDDAFSGSAEELLDFELVMAGEYLIVVSEYWENEGSYTLTVESVTAE